MTAGTVVCHNSDSGNDVAIALIRSGIWTLQSPAYRWEMVAVDILKI